MGFSVSGATAVILVGILISVSTLYPAIEQSGELRRESLDAHEERTLERHNTALTIESASYDRSAETLTITVENTGTTTVSVGKTDLLVDGAYQSNPATAVEGSSSRGLWAPGETLTYTQSGVTTAPVRVVVVTEHGVSRAETVTEVP